MTHFELVGNPEDFITLAAAVDEFGTSRSTLYRMVNDGTLPTFKRRGDRKTYVRRSDVQSGQQFKEIRSSYSPFAQADPD